jgi:uncharacterized protein DUF397
MPEFEWQKSSYSGEAANCVEVGGGADGWIRVREGDEPEAVLRVSRPAMRGLLGAVKGGLAQE